MLVCKYQNKIVLLSHLSVFFFTCLLKWLPENPTRSLPKVLYKCSSASDLWYSSFLLLNINIHTKSTCVWKYKYTIYLILDTACAIWDLEQVVVELESPLEDFQQVDTESRTAPRDAAIGHGGVITTTGRHKQNWNLRRVIRDRIIQSDIAGKISNIRII